MSNSLTHMVLFHSSKDVSREQILNALGKPFTEVSVERNSVFHVRDTEDGGEARVYYSKEDYVLAESREIAEEFAAERPDKEYIAGADRRFDVWAEADDQMLNFNPWLLTTGWLQELVQGVVFDPINGTFLEFPNR